jgi:nucleolar protein 16
LLKVSEVRVERDSQGRITRVLRGSNPLNDPLNELDDDDDDDDEQQQEGERQEDGAREGGEDDGEGQRAAKPEVLRALEMEANRPTEKVPRKQSERELEWLRRLVERHGQDVAAMARDMKLNPMQQTAADIGKRLRKAGLLAS